MKIRKEGSYIAESVSESRQVGSPKPSQMIYKPFRKRKGLQIYQRQWDPAWRLSGSTFRTSSMNTIGRAKGSKSRPFAPRPTRASAAVMIRLRSRLSTLSRCPPNEVVFWRRSMPPKTMPARICIGCCFGALLGYGRRLSLPALLWLPSPIPAAKPPALFLRNRRPSSDECANALRMRLAHEKRHFLFGRAAVRSPLHLFHLRRAACAFPLAGVRAPFGRARTATQSALRAERPSYYRESADNAVRRGYAL